MRIIRAGLQHSQVVLSLLDEFRGVVYRISDPDVVVVPVDKTSAGRVFEEVINSNVGAVFLAFNEEGDYVGIVTVYKVPQIRKGQYAAEVEEFFVKQGYHGKGVAQLLVDAVLEWAKLENLNAMRLESGNELSRAHAFYRKVGMKEYGKAFRIDF